MTNIRGLYTVMRVEGELRERGGEKALYCGCKGKERIEVGAGKRIGHGHLPRLLCCEK